MQEILIVFEELKTCKIRNVLIFVCDALSWRHAPDEITRMGVTIKTVASSLFTAPSFASIISGVYQPKHGVFGWADISQEKHRRLFALHGYNISLWCESTWTHFPPDESELHAVLGDPGGQYLGNIRTPFIYVEDDKGGHAPYGYSYDEWQQMGYSDYAREFYVKYGRLSRHELVDLYLKGIAQSVDRFKQRLEILEKRGLVDETLVIFTSDHGELLGEYGGLVGHARPACPELIYVPTVFIHPSLKEERPAGIMRHVDIYPTITAVLHQDICDDADGVDLTATKALPHTGLNFRLCGTVNLNGRLRRMFCYSSESVWDAHGGHVFHGLSPLKALIYYFYKVWLAIQPESHYMLVNIKNDRLSKRLIRRLTAMKHLISPYIVYKKPLFSKQKARQMLDEYLKDVQKPTSTRTTIDKNVKARLEALGYFD